MENQRNSPADLAHVIRTLESLKDDLKVRDWVSVIRRTCRMAGLAPADVPADPVEIRAMLIRIRPTEFGLKEKTWSTMRCALATALHAAGIIDRLPRGQASHHAEWSRLMQALSGDKRMSSGLAAFVNYWCLRKIDPASVRDTTVQEFLVWLLTRTLYPKPRDVARWAPKLWNEAARKVAGWPRVELAKLSFRAPSKRRQWHDLPSSYRCDVDAYLAARAEPDPFDERAFAPRRPLAPTTLRLQREHLRLAASVLAAAGTPPTRLADVVEREAFKRVLRHYCGSGSDQPNRFAVSISKTLLQVARYHVHLTAVELDDLKGLAARLPAIPLDLTGKNKALIRKFDSDQLRAKLVFLPDELLQKSGLALRQGKIRLVDAQVAVAIDILLAIPLRPRNLSRLNWRRHFSEPNGPRGPLYLHIPGAEMKSGKDYDAEVPEEVARRLRWYRKKILVGVGAPPQGNLFVTTKGRKKSQSTITAQIIKMVAKHVGVHMTPHQFRHLAACHYLDEHASDFQTARALLGHSSVKSTLIYAGRGDVRASRAYNTFVFEKRAALAEKLPSISRNRRRQSCAS